MAVELWEWASENAFGEEFQPQSLDSGHAAPLLFQHSPGTQPQGVFEVDSV